MLRKHAASLFLIGLAFVLGIWVWVDRGSITDTERQMRSRNVFPAYRKDEVVRVELHGEKGDIVLEREGDAGDPSWSLRSPMNERADSHAVDTLLGAIEFATRVRKAPDDAPGLDHPRVKGSISMGAVTFTFALGGDAPTPKGAAYLRVDGEGTYVVTGELVRQLLLGANDYRSRTVVPYLSIDLRKMSIFDPNGKGFSIERTDDIGFMLPELGLRASRETLDRIWLALSDLRASDFLSDAEADQALKPALTIEMTPRDAAKPKGRMRIGGACPRHADDVVLVRTEPTRASACVPGGLVDRLRAEPSELVDARLFLARLDEVESFKMSAAGLTIDLARKGSGWVMRSPDSRELASDEADMATALIGSIVHGQGKSMAAGRPSFEVNTRIVVTRVESHVEETLEVGTDEKKNTVVRRVQDGAIGTVDPDLARKLVPSLVAFRGRTIWSPSVESANFTGLSLDCDGVRQELVRDKSWRYETPKDMPADDAAATEVADAIARVKPEAWVAENDDGTFGFEKAKCTAALRIESDAGARTVRLFFGNRTDSGVYARAEGQNPIFLVPHAVRGAASRLLVDRGALAVDPAKIDKVVLVKGNTRFVLHKTSGKLTAPDGGTSELIDDVAHAIGLLRADDAVHFGPPTADEGPPTLDIRVTQNGKESVIHVGRALLRRDQKMYFARIEGVGATFAVAKERIEPLLDPFVPPK
jgi:hypothetical protein